MAGGGQYGGQGAGQYGGAGSGRYPGQALGSILAQVVGSMVAVVDRKSNSLQHRRTGVASAVDRQPAIRASNFATRANEIAKTR